MSRGPAHTEAACSSGPSSIARRGPRRPRTRARSCASSRCSGRRRPPSSVHRPSRTRTRRTSATSRRHARVSARARHPRRTSPGNSVPGRRRGRSTGRGGGVGRLGGVFRGDGGDIDVARRRQSARRRRGGGFRVGGAFRGGGGGGGGGGAQQCARWYTSPRRAPKTPGFRRRRVDPRMSVVFGWTRPRWWTTRRWVRTTRFAAASRDETRRASVARRRRGPARHVRARVAASSPPPWTRARRRRASR